MKSISAFAIAVSLLAGGAVVAAPAAAQKNKKQAAAAQSEQWKPTLTKEEAAALQPVEKAIQAQDWAAAQAALPAAAAAAKSPDARFYVGQFTFNIGANTNNAALQSQGIDSMVASGGGDPTRRAALYKAQGQLAAQAKDFPKAEAAYARWAQLVPNDPDAGTIQAELKFLQGKYAEVLPLAQTLIRQREAAGQAVPESLYALALQSAANAKMWPQAVEVSKALVSKYPNQKNWRNALLLYRQTGKPQGPALVDTLRLMRAAKVIETSDESLALADLLARGRFYAEARDVLEEAFAAGRLQRTNGDAVAILNEVRPRIAEDLTALSGLEPRARSAANGELALRLAEGYYGHGQYAKAATFYRLALEKGGVDAGLVNSRLGMALAMAGQKAEAETALKAVNGPRSPLASYWLLWSGQRA